MTEQELRQKSYIHADMHIGNEFVQIFWHPVSASQPNTLIKHKGIDHMAGKDQFVHAIQWAQNIVGGLC